MQGKIIRGIGGFYYVDTDLPGVVECKAKGIFRNKKVKPLVGDNVEVKILDREKMLGSIEKILPKMCIRDSYIRDVRGTYLIHGITGSGKTEVYMNIVEKVICLGKQAIVLIPEISLTFQMVNRFYKRFGNRISVMHSRLSAGEMCIRDRWKAELLH